MVTPSRRRQAVIMFEDEFGVSQRRACTVVGQHRSTQRFAPPARTAEEDQIRAHLRDFANKRPRWGWRRAAKDLRRNGYTVNDKRVRRLWREEGLRVPTKKRKKRVGAGNSVVSL